MALSLSLLSLPHSNGGGLCLSCHSCGGGLCLSSQSGGGGGGRFSSLQSRGGGGRGRFLCPRPRPQPGGGGGGGGSSSSLQYSSLLDWPGGPCPLPCPRCPRCPPIRLPLCPSQWCSPGQRPSCGDASDVSRFKQHVQMRNSRHVVKAVAICNRIPVMIVRLSDRMTAAPLHQEISILTEGTIFSFVFKACSRFVCLSV